jgi:hypothetical protein
MLSLSRGGTKSDVVALQVLQLPYKNENLSILLHVSFYEKCNIDKTLIDDLERHLVLQ